MRLSPKFSLIVIGIVLVVSIAAVGQGYNPFNQRDDKYRLLGLKRAKEAFEIARTEYDRQKEMFGRDLSSTIQLEQARRAFSEAEVNYQQSLLSVLFEEQFISVIEAVKYQAQDGSKHVRLTLANTSGGTEEFDKLLNVDDELFRSLQPDVIQNVYVSLLNNDNTIISQPYETKLTELRFGQPQRLDFRLLQDLDVVTVFLIYGNGSQRSMKIFLQKDATENRVAVQSEQFSQEIELGQSASFDLTLEMFSGLTNTFSLEVVNLPKAVDRYFKESNGNARLSQIKFAESSRTKPASLEITLPDRPTDEIVMDVAIPFYVLVIPREAAESLPELTTRHWTESELEELDVGYVRLELVPRGKGKLLVRSPQLFHSIQLGESVAMSVDILNEGSHRLDNIEVSIDLPHSWTKEISPRTIASLAIGEEARVNLTFIPPADVPPGKYEARLRTSATSASQPVTGLDKSVTIEVRPETNVLGTIALVLAVISLVGGIVVYGIRLSRR